MPLNFLLIYIFLHAKNSSTAEGIVTNKKNHTSYADMIFINSVKLFFSRKIAVIHFTDKNNTGHDFLTFSFRNHFLSKNSRVSVQYFRNYPEEARIKPILPFNGIQILFAVLSVFFLSIALLSGAGPNHLQFNSIKLLTSFMRILRRGTYEEIMMFIVFPYSFFLFGGISFIMSIVMMRKEIRSKTWSSVAGKPVSKFKIGASYRSSYNHPVSKLQ